ncbi:MAG TPA: sugar phosphate nucleotidyltransferase [Candidatus Saccharimonadales bacterium]|nr:sugar phosphate nucleotidyltransferase [Candidatus Saccharimonadales bacterium]
MQKQPVRKAVVAAAGFGTRFLPQTKAMPKEMLPLVDKPIIQYIVEELVDAGIEDVIIQVRNTKRAIEDHFDLPSSELIANLRSGGPSKEQLIKEIKAIPHMANFIFVRARAPYGNAAPVSDASHLIGGEPFIYTFADDFFFAQPSRFKQMISLYQERGGSVISCIEAQDEKDFSRYGFIGGEQVEDGLFKAVKIVEKPGKDKAPSNLASVSSYLFEPKILNYIEKEKSRLEPDREFYIQPAMQAMINDGNAFWGLKIKNSTYYDTGDKLEYLKTVVDFGIKHAELGEDFKSYLRTLRF